MRQPPLEQVAARGKGLVPTFEAVEVGLRARKQRGKFRGQRGEEGGLRGCEGGGGEELEMLGFGMGVREILG